MDYERRRNCLLVMMTRQTDQWLKEDALRALTEQRRKERRKKVEDHYRQEVAPAKKKKGQEVQRVQGEGVGHNHWPYHTQQMGCTCTDF